MAYVVKVSDIRYFEAPSRLTKSGMARLSAIDSGRVKTRNHDVFRGLFTIPGLVKTRSERFGRPRAAVVSSSLRFYTASTHSGHDVALPSR